MGRFYSRALNVLDRLYQFDAGQSFPTTVDTAGQIQLVHDVSREAELDQDHWYFGLGNFSLVNTHAVAAGEVQSNLPLGPGAQFWDTAKADPGRDWLWFWDATILVPNTLTFASATLTLYQGGQQPVGLTEHRVPLRAWASVTPQIILSTELNRAGLETFNLNAGRPKVLPLNSTLYFHSDASGAVADILCQITAWIGPKGAFPPGLG